MWAGQFFGELLNWIIKHAIKEERPIREFSIIEFLYALTTELECIFGFLERIGNGYGFPSSHSQYMAYFSSFLVCHLYMRHRFSSTGYPFIDFLWRMFIYAALIGWSGMVAYSRSV